MCKPHLSQSNKIKERTFNFLSFIIHSRINIHSYLGKCDHYYHKMIKQLWREIGKIK